MTTMQKKRLLKVLAITGGAAVTLLGGLFAVAYHESEQPREAPVPAISADRSPEGVARGAAIFHATCEACHRAPGAERASGAPMREAPEWLGSLHSANITSDAAAGIGRLSDGLAARMIRYGVSRDGRWGPMPAYGLSDADLAAVLGFLRSDDPLFKPDPRPAPRTRLSLAGRAALFLAGTFTPPSRPASITAPPKAASLEYGRYLAEGVYQCGDCHTPGFDADKLHGPDAFIGGAELQNSAGKVVYSPNLTRDEATGIGRWSREQFAVAIRSGIRPDGSALGSPMPLFRGADDTEVDALLLYLRSFPARANAVPGQKPALAQATPPSTNPQQAFERLGCATCHGKGAPFEAKLAQAAGKPASDVARWIRNPESFRPGTAMPSFASVLDEPSAVALAEWLQKTPR
jgi:mono/diheme cytochrome c family protein